MNITFSNPLKYKDKTYTKGIIYNSKPKGETPKTYKDVGLMVSVPELTSTYNSGRMTIYVANDKTFRFSIFQDGCFHPYYGKITLVEE